MSFYPLKEPKYISWVPCALVSIVGHIILCLAIFLASYMLKPTSVININTKNLAKVHFESKQTTSKPASSKAVTTAIPKKAVKQDLKKIVPKKPIKKEAIKKIVKPIEQEKIKPEPAKVIEKKAIPKQEFKKKEPNIKQEINPLKKEIIEPKPKPKIQKKEEKITPEPPKVPEVYNTPISKVPEIPEIPEIIDLNINEASWLQYLRSEIINNIDAYFLDDMPNKEIICLINVEKTGTSIIIEGLENYAIYAASLREALLKIQYPARAYGKTLKLIITG